MRRLATTIVVLAALLACASAGEKKNRKAKRPKTAAGPASAPVNGKSHALGNLAASMKPGDWKELKTQGFSVSFLRDQGASGKPAHWIFQYTHKIHWYAKTQELYFMGAGHRCRGKFIAYSATKNAWRNMPIPEPYNSRKGRTGLSHSYENSTIDEQKGWFVRQCHDMKKLMRYDIAAAKWLATIPAPSKQGHESATEYFPEMKTYVRFERKGAKRLLKWARVGQKWVAMSPGVAAGASRELHPIIEYNPVHKIMLFGAGNKNNDLFCLSVDGRVKAIAKCPVTNINSTFKLTLTVDPVSGEYLLFTPGGGKGAKLKLHIYDPKTDKWRAGPAAGMNIKKGTAVSTPVADHGVVLFCTYNPASVWLYKHAAGK